MAKRRRKLHRVLEGLGSGLMDAGGMMLRQKLMQDQNAMIADRQEDAAERNQMFEIVKMLAKNEIDPEMASRVTGMNLSRFQPGADFAAAGMVGDIEKADSLSKLPTAAGIHTVARRNKKLSTPTVGGTEQYDKPEQLTGREEEYGFELPALHAESFGPMENPALQRVLDTRAEKEEALQSEVPWETVTGIDPVTGLKTERRVQKNKLGEVGPQAQERTTDAEGARQGGIAAATERLKRPETVETQFQTLMAGYRPEVTSAKSTQEGAVAGARTTAEQRAMHSPEAIAGAAKRAGEIARAQAEAQVAAELKSGKLSVSQAQAAGNYIRISQEHATMKALEDKGVRFANLTHQARQIPLVGGAIANQMGRVLSPLEQEYLRSADQFKALEGKIMSGVTVRPDEGVNFIQDLTAQSSDDDTVVAGKQAAREAILTAAQIQAGPGGNYQAGLSLGKSILGGTVKVDTIMRLQFSNADLLRGLADAGVTIGIRQGAQ